VAKVIKKPALIHYRRLEDVTGVFQGTTLEAEVRRAMASPRVGQSRLMKDDYHLRVWTPQAGGDSLFINQNSDGAPAYYFGDLVHFVGGHMQALFEAVPNALPSAPVKQMAAQGGEFIHSVLFWYIRANHVFLLQGRTARTVDLERYLSWLLTDGTGAMTTPVNVILRSKFSPEAVGGDLQEIEEINIGGSLRASDMPTPIGAATKAVEAHETFAGGADRNLAAEVIRAVTGDAETADEFLSKIDARAELRVRVTIGYKAKRVQLDKRPLRDLEIGLRNLPEAEVTVRAKGGKKTPLGELQLTYPTKVAVRESLWDPKDVLEAFGRAYQEFAASGKIDNGDDD
jgi:hypothetical protein